MEFYGCSMHSPEEYKEIILSHEGAVKTENAEWLKAIEAGKKVWPYSASMVPEEPNDETIIYFEFVDDDLNIYVDFFHMKSMEWIESYRFTDKDYAWTIFIDNLACCNPLSLHRSKLQELLTNFELEEENNVFIRTNKRRVSN